MIVWGVGHTAPCHDPPLSTRSDCGTVWTMSLPEFSPTALFVARWNRGWSRAHLAGLAGVTDETIRRAEKGQYKPRADTLAALAAALDLDPSDLFERAA